MIGASCLSSVAWATPKGKWPERRTTMPGERTLLALIFAVVLCAGPGATAQEPSRVEIQRILQEASAITAGQDRRAQANLGPEIAAGQVRIGDISGAMQTARTMRDNDVQAVALGLVAWWLDRAGNTPAAFQVAAQIKDEGRRANAYRDIALGRASRGEFEAAIRATRLLENRPKERAFTLEWIARDQARAGDTRGSAQTLVEARLIVDETEDDDRALPEMIQQLVAAEVAVADPAVAEQALQRLQTLAHKETDPQRRMARLQELAITQAEAGEIALARQTAGELPAGAWRNRVLMTAAGVQAARGDGADGVRTAGMINDPGLRAVTIRQIASTMDDAGDSVGAMEAIDEISDPAARAEALAWMALGEAIRRVPRAAQTLARAREATEGMKAERTISARSLMASVQALLGDLSGAREAVDQLPDGRWKQEPLSNLARVMAEAGDWDGALALASSQPATAMRAAALASAATGALDRMEEQREKHSRQM